MGIHHPSWGCAGEFLKIQGSPVKRFAAGGKSNSNAVVVPPNGSSIITIPRGNWIKSNRSFTVPMDFNAEIRALEAPGTIYVSLFNSAGSKTTGLTIESGASNGQMVKVLHEKKVGKPMKLGNNNKWHKVQIAVNSDGNVKYYVNGKLLSSGFKTTLRKGGIAFIGGNQPMQVRNVNVKVLATTFEKDVRKCKAKESKDPQDGGDIYKQPSCPKF